MARPQVRNLEKTLGGSFNAVHRINLGVRGGETVLLVGPSGCAKSTTLRMIARLERTTGGQVMIGDTVVNRLQPGKRGIAMVFQNHALVPHMKEGKNLSFGLRLQRASRSEIEPLLYRLSKELSGSQAQRMDRGPTLINEPMAFLFGEPLSNPDAKLR